MNSENNNNPILIAIILTLAVLALICGPQYVDSVTQR